MAGLGEAVDGGEQPFMVSSLPLVFCDGHPVALENMPDRSLVKFVRFLLKCALGVDEHRLRTVRRPSWWPRTVPYFNLKASNEVNKGHAERLRELVRCCYRGADCEYLMRFCADLEPHCVSGRMAFKNNFDGSSSLYELATNRLVVTCRNENLEYDRPKNGPLSPRRHLLPRQLSRSASQQLAMVQPPPDDIFLCDTCSAEFSSVDAVQAHERQCGVPAAEESPPSDTESVTSEPEVQCASQSRFLSYVGLAPADGSGKEPYSSPTKRGGGGAAALARLRRGPSLLLRYQTIDVSSPLGRRLGAGQPPSDQHPPEHEKYCEDSERKRLARQPSFPVSWRPPRKGRHIVYGWSHLYCFTAAQRAERRRTIRAGLTDQARRLVQTVLPCSVRLTRLTAEEIKEATRPRPAPVQPLWRPPASVRGTLWRPGQTLVSPDPYRVADRSGARYATSALAAAAAAAATASTSGAVDPRAVSGSARALRTFRSPRTGLPAGMTRPRTAQAGTTPLSLPSGLSIKCITPQNVAPKPQIKVATTPSSRGTVWRPTLVGTGGKVIKPALVGASVVLTPPLARGRSQVRYPTVRGRPQSGGVKALRKPVPSKPLIGKELKDKETVVIDLCSSSDEEGDPPPAAPPPLPPPPRIKAETTASQAATSTNGSSWQSKNAHSHWSRSCGGLANGVSSFASLDAGHDGGLLDGRLTTAEDTTAALSFTLSPTVAWTCGDQDCGAIGAKRYQTVSVADGDGCCDAGSVLQSSQISSMTSGRDPREKLPLSLTDKPPVSYSRRTDDIMAVSAQELRAASDHGCEGDAFKVDFDARWFWTLASRAA
ncbi:uncharacterized protein LOC122381795 [Amphibalanus amphitrite]|uniref:uncharacterized protein LOC122381795 n=1 Tax=Amphibalanus amphitrite TaxID=1232801 RepID=UPI001C91C68D|nr:uncharacterized protein LOC122381795 [Amphibalanus amphitrite]XP_043222373.1 uncharacterized protein LOC122381795 [Amphibalanus amphitrite]XP_043222374.1 uncharacterized protein LOC122381795 [Amphibalanus amphitrite]XP_043222376.1 uncharacterized protein LOC122381795 [Amphibalanus amphitrite]XP_043222377.1 uncharacterized protein LOC122381795 [Amphibalanus amphitrite]